MSRIGIVAALPAEALILARRGCGIDAILDLDEVLLACSGTGPQRAEKYARTLVERGVSGLVSFGTAGGLAPDVQAGDLLLPPRVLTVAGATCTCDPPWRARLEQAVGALVPLRVGDQLMNDAIVATAREKAHLAETGALAVDMESAAVGAVARDAGLPFVVVRAVCDSAHRSLPRGALVAIDASGRFRPGPFVGYIVRRPLEILDLLALRRDLNAALRTLRKVVKIAGRGLLRA